MRTGRNASLVGLFAEPADLLAAVQGERLLPPLSPCEQFLLVAPGIPGVARPTEAPEIALWRSLAEPRTVGRLLQEHPRITLETLWRAGVIEAA